MSVLGSNLTPRKPSFEEAPSKNLAGAEATKKDTEAIMETTDKSLEKPSKNLKPGSAADAAKADVKKKPAAAEGEGAQPEKKKVNIEPKNIEDKSC